MYILKTRYYGAKTKLIPNLEKVFSEIEFSSATDLFGGTGVVSLLLANMGKQVVYNDGFLFNGAIARAVLASSSSLPSKNDVEKEIKKIIPKDGVVSRNFEGIFYKDFENNWLDGYLQSRSKHQSLLSDVVFYCVAQACLKKRPFNLFHRANLYLRDNSEVERSFGNKYSWDKSFLDHCLLSLSELYSIPRKFSDEKIKIYSKSAEEVLVETELLYLDPPYITKSGSESYLKRYHFLEGMYIYPEWESLISNKFKSKSLVGYEFVEKSSTKVGLISLMDKVISRFKGRYIVLSYLKDGLDVYEKLKDLISNEGFDITEYELDHKHVLSKNSVSEVIVVGRKYG